MYITLVHIRSVIVKHGLYKVKPEKIHISDCTAPVEEHLNGN